MTDSGRYVRGDFRYEVWNGDPQGGSLATTGTPDRARPPTTSA